MSYFNTKMFKYLIDKGKIAYLLFNYPIIIFQKKTSQLLASTFISNS